MSLKHINKTSGPHQAVYLPDWFYVSGTSVSADDNQQVAWPLDANVCVISAEAGLAHYDLGDQAADPGSGGHIPADTTVVIGPLQNQPANLNIWLAAATVAHIQFFAG